MAKHRKTSVTRRGRRHPGKGYNRHTKGAAKTVIVRTYSSRGVGKPRRRSAKRVQTELRKKHYHLKSTRRRRLDTRSKYHKRGGGGHKSRTIVVDRTYKYRNNPSYDDNPHMSHHYSDNPILSVVDMVVGAGTLAAGFIAADALDRFLATQPAQSGGDPITGFNALALINAPPTLMRAGAQIALAAVGAAGAAYIPNTTAKAAAGGLMVGSLSHLIVQLWDSYAGPKMSPDRLYPKTEMATPPASTSAGISTVAGFSHSNLGEPVAQAGCPICGSIGVGCGCMSKGAEAARQLFGNALNPLAPPTVAMAAPTTVAPTTVAPMTSGVPAQLGAPVIQPQFRMKPAAPVRRHG